MKRLISLITAIAFFMVIPGADFCLAKEDRVTIAVIDFQPLGVSASESIFITEFFRTRLVSSREFKVVDKANMDKILAEQGFQQTGCTTQECAVQSGEIVYGDDGECESAK